MAGKTDPKKLERNRLYRERNREKLRAWNRKYYAENAEKRRECAKRSKLRNPEERAQKDAVYAKKWRAERRASIISLFGGKCCRCGFDDWRALQVDHVNGGGNKQRKSGISLWSYYDEIESGDRSKLQLLCANCNQIKRYEEGEHRSRKTA